MNVQVSSNFPLSLVCSPFFQISLLVKNFFSVPTILFSSSLPSDLLSFFVFWMWCCWTWRVKAWSMSLIIIGGLLVNYEMPLFCILMFAGVFLLGTIGLREFIFSAIVCSMGASHGVILIKFSLLFFFFPFHQTVFIRPELKRLKLDTKEDDIWKTCCHINFYRQRTS